MKFKLAISFVMPAYNCAETINEAIESIIESNFQAEDELIIVNDGSTDSTPIVISELQKDHPFIKLISNPVNLGCPATRNIGISGSKNPYIFNLDSDDVLAKNSRALLEEAIITQKADVAAFGEIHFFDEDIEHITHKWICKPGVLTLADYLAGHVIPGGNYLYAKKSWERVGGYYEIGTGLHEFWGFGLKQIAMGSKFYVVPNSHYFHRYGGDSLYTRERKKQNSSLVATQMIEPFLGLIEDEDAHYIQSEDGKNKWFVELWHKPIHVKYSPVGTTGTIVHIRRPLYKKIWKKMRRMILRR